MDSQWGRIDADGTVYVKTPDGEREIGSWQAGDAAAGLAFYGRRYDDLATEVDLLERRLESGAGDPRATHKHAEELAAQLDTAAAIGDLAGLRRAARGAGRRRGRQERAARGCARRRPAPRPSRRRSGWSPRPRRSRSPARPGRPRATGCGPSSRSGSRSRVSTARPTRRCGSASRPRATRSASGAASTSPSWTPIAARHGR